MDTVSQFEQPRRCLNNPTGNLEERRRSKMKKLFRFKYEKCNGSCYTGGDDFYAELKPLSPEKKLSLVSEVVAAHNRLCDNPSFSFGLDKCEKTGLFIAYFLQPNRTDLFTDLSLETCIRDLCEFVMDTNVPTLKGVCEFGSHGNENLAELILAHSV